MAWQLYYDGGCNLCHTSKLRVEKWAERRGFPIAVDVLACDDAVAKGYGGQMVLETGDKTLFAADAAIELMQLGPWYVRWIYVISRVKGLRAIVKLVYGIIATNRYRLFGTRSCQIPVRK